MNLFPLRLTEKVAEDCLKDTKQIMKSRGHLILRADGQVGFGNFARNKNINSFFVRRDTGNIRYALFVAALQDSGDAMSVTQLMFLMK